MKSLYNKWVALIWKKIEDFVQDWLIISIITTGIFYTLKASSVKQPKASVDAMDIMKLPGRIVSGVLVKEFTVYKKWIKEWYNNKFYSPVKGNKIT